MITAVKKSAAAAVLVLTGCAAAPITPAPNTAAGAVEAANSLEVDAPRWRREATVSIGPHPIERYRMGGLEVLIGVDQWTEIFTYETWFDVGTHDDPPGREGMVELAYQLVRTAGDSPQMGRLEALGARVRSGLGPDWTFLGVTASARAPVEAVVAIEAGRLARAGSGDVARARNAAKAMLRRLRGRSVRFQLEEALFGNLFAAGSAAASYGTPTLARQVGLLSLPAEEGRTFAKRRFNPDRALIIVLGAVDRTRVLSAIRRHLGPQLSGVRRPAPPAPPTTTAAVTASIDLRLAAESEYALLGWALPGASSDDHLALEGAAIHLASGPLASARTRIDATSLDTWTARHRHGGAFAVMVAASATATTAAQVAESTVVESSRKPPSDQALAELQATLRGRTWRRLDQLADRSRMLAEYELCRGGIENLASRLARIDTLTAEDITSSLARHVAPKKPVLVIGRPKERRKP